MPKRRQPPVITNRRALAVRFTVASLGEADAAGGSRIPFTPVQWPYCWEGYERRDIVVAYTVDRWEIPCVAAYAHVRDGVITIIFSKEPGAGTAIMRWLQERHPLLIASNVARHNPTGLSFWRAMGFRDTAPDAAPDEHNMIFTDWRWDAPPAVSAEE